MLREGDSPIFVASCHKNRDSPLTTVGRLAKTDAGDYDLH